MTVTNVCYDKRGQYRELHGVKYRHWEHRGFWVSQAGGRQSMLHRKLWEHHNGDIPKAHAVVPVDGDFENLTLSNWECRPHGGNGKAFEAVHPMVEFGGYRYYRAKGRKYYYHTSNHGRKTLLHRDKFIDAFGPIPQDWEVHHKDFDASNNDLNNLQAMPMLEHRRLHGEARRND